MITTPYNFVPLNKKVISPWWANHISHDIPFENAQSGTLELTITAKSPIYVRNGLPKFVGKEKTPAHEAYKRLLHQFNFDGNSYFIPGSSIKGMIRNVQEIMSFGSIEEKVVDQRYSVRDFHNDKIYKPSDISKDVCCGWLQKIDGEYFLIDCGEPGRISHKEIDKMWKSSMTPFFSKDEYYKENIEYKNRKVSAKSAHFKYLKFDFSLEAEFEEVKSSDPRPIFTFGKGKKGVTVMTGQPGKRFNKSGKWEGKHLEFIFFKSTKEPELVDEDVIKNFLFAYYDHDKNQQNDDWKWRSQQLKNGEKIPVFFRRKHDGKGIKDMGLSYLYKITYKHSVHDSIKEHQVKCEGMRDLSECIFGYADKDSALKSRVHVGHARLQSEAKVMTEMKEVLSGPKASFYPTYLFQGDTEKIKGEYKTFMDEKPPLINGWKRYPIHFNGVKTNPPPVIKGKVNEKVATKFIPLAEGATFKCSINYHNLRLEELGSLVSAITFHNTEGIFHSLGMAKPLGYGKVSLSIDNHNEVMIKAMKDFECFMDMQLQTEKQKWISSEQIINLLSMAKGSPSVNVDGDLTYMKETKLFSNAKKAKQALPRFAKMVGAEFVECRSLVNADEYQKYTKNAEAEIKKLSPFKTREEAKNEAIGDAKKSLDSALEERKRELLAELRERRDYLRQKKKEEQERQEQEQRAQKRAEQARDAVTRGLDLSHLDFGKSFRATEQAIIKAVEDYVLKVYQINNLAKLESPYLNKSVEINSVIEALHRLIEILPKKEKEEKKMKPRFARYTKWMGEEKVQQLKQNMKV